MQGRVPAVRDRSHGGAGTRQRRREGRRRRGCGARRQHARLSVRPLQDQAQGRRRGPEQGAHDARRRRRRGRAQGVGRASRRSLEGVVLARDLVNEPPNVLYPVEFARRAARTAQARRRGRDPRREGDAQARHGRAARRRAGLDAREPHRRSCAGTAARRARRRSPSSARACASTPAASRSSRPPAWRT